MIARFQIAVPFVMAVPRDLNFNLYTFEYLEGYRVTFLPPVQTAHPLSSSRPEDMTVDGTGWKWAGCYFQRGRSPDSAQLTQRTSR